MLECSSPLIVTVGYSSKCTISLLTSFHSCLYRFADCLLLCLRYLGIIAGFSSLHFGIIAEIIACIVLTLGGLLPKDSVFCFELLSSSCHRRHFSSRDRTVHFTDMYMILKHLFFFFFFGHWDLLVVHSAICVLLFLAHTIFYLFHYTRNVAYRVGCSYQGLDYRKKDLNFLLQDYHCQF